MKKILLVLTLVLSLTMLFSCTNALDEDDSDLSYEGEIENLDSLIDSIMEAGFSDSRERLAYIFDLFLPAVQQSKALTSYKVDENGVLTLIYGDGSSFEFGKIIYPEGTKFFVVTFESEVPISPILAVGGASVKLPTPAKEGYSFDGWQYKDAEGWLTYDAAAAVSRDLTLRPVFSELPPANPPAEDNPPEDDGILSSGAVNSIDELVDIIMEAGFSDTKARLTEFLNGYVFIDRLSSYVIPSSYELSDDGKLMLGYPDGSEISAGKVIYPAGTKMWLVTFEAMAAVDYLPPILVADGEVPALPVLSKPDMTFLCWCYYEEPTFKWLTYDEKSVATSDIKLMPMWQSSIPQYKIVPMQSIIDAFGREVSFEQFDGGRCDIPVLAGGTSTVTVYLKEKRCDGSLSIQEYSDGSFSVRELSYTEDKDGYAAVLVIEVYMQYPEESCSAHFMYEMENQSFSYELNFVSGSGSSSSETVSKFKYATVSGGISDDNILLVTPETTTQLYLYFTGEVNIVSIKLVRNGIVINIPDLNYAGMCVLGYELCMDFTLYGEEDAELEIIWKQSSSAKEEITETYIVKPFIEEPTVTVPSIVNVNVNKGGNFQSYNMQTSTFTFEESADVEIEFQLSHDLGAPAYEGITVILDGNKLDLTKNYVGEFYQHVVVGFKIPSVGNHSIVIKFDECVVKEMNLVSNPGIQIDPDAVTTAVFNGLYTGVYAESRRVERYVETGNGETVLYLAFSEKVRLNSIVITRKGEPSITSSTVISIGESGDIFFRYPVTVTQLPEGEHTITVNFSSLNAPDEKTATFDFCATPKITTHDNGFYGYNDENADFIYRAAPCVTESRGNFLNVYFAEGAEVLELIDVNSSFISASFHYYFNQNGMDVYEFEFYEYLYGTSPVFKFSYKYNGNVYEVTQPVYVPNM